MFALREHDWIRECPVNTIICCLLRPGGTKMQEVQALSDRELQSIGQRDAADREICTIVVEERGPVDSLSTEAGNRVGPVIPSAWVNRNRVAQ